MIKDLKLAYSISNKILTLKQILKYQDSWNQFKDWEQNYWVYPGTSPSKLSHSRKLRFVLSVGFDPKFFHRLTDVVQMNGCTGLLNRVYDNKYLVLKKTDHLQTPEQMLG